MAAACLGGEARPTVPLRQPTNVGLSRTKRPGPTTMSGGPQPTSASRLLIQRRHEHGEHGAILGPSSACLHRDETPEPKRTQADSVVLYEDRVCE
jgi:hypothetical protein